MFRETCLEVAKRFPKIQVEEQLVDSMVYKMIISPQQYDVVVAPNLYGDILSDAGAALVIIFFFFSLSCLFNFCFQQGWWTGSCPFNE